MLVTDLHAIGNALLSFRKHAGLTQAEAAEAAGLSDRTYAGAAYHAGRDPHGGEQRKERPQ